jgi:hypothetical protein
VSIVFAQTETSPEDAPEDVAGVAVVSVPDEKWGELGLAPFVQRGVVGMGAWPPCQKRTMAESGTEPG